MRAITGEYGMFDMKVCDLLLIGARHHILSTHLQLPQRHIIPIIEELQHARSPTESYRLPARV
jgi:hypothetical protein